MDLAVWDVKVLRLQSCMTVARVSEWLCFKALEHQCLTRLLTGSSGSTVLRPTCALAKSKFAVLAAFVRFKVDSALGQLGCCAINEVVYV